MTTEQLDVSPAAIAVGEIFADTTYQRVLDVARAGKMTATWDRRLAGILEVSDRGESAAPRYAVLDGQHRWAAAKFMKDPPALVANVHTGLSLAEEAALFDKLNRQRKQITTWDHWRARRAAADPLVLAIEQTVAGAGLRVSEQTSAGDTVCCISTLEKIAASAGGIQLLATALDMLTLAWGHQRTAYEAHMVHAMAMVIYTFDERLDADRFIAALSAIAPKRIHVAATTLRDMGTSGSLAKLSAAAMLNQYNQTSGKRLAWPHSWKGAIPKPSKDTQPTLVAPAVPSDSCAKPDTTQVSPPADTCPLPPPAVEIAEQVRPGPLVEQASQPAAAEDHHDAVMAMQDRTVTEVADALGITERAVRRIRADLGLD